MALTRIVEARNLKRAFEMGSERISALDGVSLELERGERLAITGPSGCGKSTLMNILGLLDPPDEGTYRLDGKDVSHLSDPDRSRIRNQGIGFVFQSFNLLPRLSALRNVEMPLVYSLTSDAGRSREAIRLQALAALERVGLSDRVDHKPNELSGGQRQRVAIARAIVANPSLLLADEPTGNLDSRSGREIMALFETLNTAGMTLVIVTHDPQIADSALRVVKMLDGRITDDRKR